MKRLTQTITTEQAKQLRQLAKETCCHVYVDRGIMKIKASLDHPLPISIRELATTFPNESREIYPAEWSGNRFMNARLSKTFNALRVRVKEAK